MSISAISDILPQPVHPDGLAGEEPMDTAFENIKGTVGTQTVDDPKMSARGVDVFYGDKQAIYDVSLDIGNNEVIAMIGPSGCGKSTFLRCLNRMNVTESLKRAGLFDEVKDRLDSPGTGLSGGQQQRLCIARTIAVNPEVILMDEPCSALDPIATARIEELIDELRQNYAIAIVTHSMQQAARVSQRTAYFHLGKLVEVDDTNSVFTNPQHELTENYITGRFG